MIYIAALGVGLKCPRKINLNTQWGVGIKGRAIYTVLQINLVICKFFGSPEVPIFQNFSQSVQPGNSSLWLIESSPVHPKNLISKIV